MPEPHTCARPSSHPRPEHSHVRLQLYASHRLDWKTSRLNGATQTQLINMETRTLTGRGLQGPALQGLNRQASKPVVAPCLHGRASQQRVAAPQVRVALTAVQLAGRGRSCSSGHCQVGDPPTRATHTCSCPRRRPALQQSLVAHVQPAGLQGVQPSRQCSSSGELLRSPTRRRRWCLPATWTCRLRRSQIWRTSWQSAMPAA